MDELKRVAFLGLGIMGAPMAANLARGGVEVVVWNRTRERADELAADAGVEVAASPAEAAEGADAVITMVVDAPQVEEVLFGDEGAATTASDGTLFVDMSTISPTAARELAERLLKLELRFLEAPVSGSRPKAEAGTLTIMAGGGREEFERARPLFEAMGERIVHVGPQGHAALAKLLTNTMGAVNAAALAEALTVATRAGLDADAFLEVAAGSSGASAMLQLKARPMLEGSFEPLFKLEHMLKDIRHGLAEAEALELHPELGRVAERLYAAAAESGHGHEDFAAVIRASEAAAGA